MIDELHVQSVALIKDATITPSSGLTVLTGETGAGKTALLSALKLLVGERADVSAVREGDPFLQVEGRVFLGVDDLDGHIVRRRVEAQGRGRIEFDGHMASVSELAETVGVTVELCGQHEHQHLLQVSSHVGMLDAWIGEPAAKALAAYQEALAAAQAAQDELDRVSELARAGSEQLDQAAFEVRRIDEVSPQEGELEQLEEALPRAEHAEALMRAAEAARDAISTEGGASDALYSAQSALREASRFDNTLEEFSDNLNSSIIEIEDIAQQLRNYRDSIDLDPEELVHMQERMAALQGLMRSFGPSMSDVFERRAKAQEILDAAGDSGELLRRARRTLTEAEEALAQAGDTLDAVRAQAAPHFCAAVGEQMARLEMGSATLGITSERLERKQWSHMGPSRIELMYRPGADLSARPLRKIASGGEVSRVMLAIKVVMGEADAIDTLVFDEVDAGVGGATARSLALVLKDLSKTHQVIVVTHLAQVAVMGERHYVVRKLEGTTTETVLNEVTGDERVAEIARMLSGDTSSISLEHARTLLAES